MKKAIVITVIVALAVGAGGGMWLKITWILRRLSKWLRSRQSYTDRCSISMTTVLPILKKYWN